MGTAGQVSFYDEFLEIYNPTDSAVDLCAPGRLSYYLVSEFAESSIRIFQGPVVHDTSRVFDITLP